MATRSDSASASRSNKLELDRGGREYAVADEEGSAVHVDVRCRVISKGEMIEIRRAGGNFDGGRAGVGGVELKTRISNARLRRSRRAADGEVIPVRNRGRADQGAVTRLPGEARLVTLKVRKPR
jgi:hypothetical protein